MNPEFEVDLCSSVEPIVSYSIEELPQEGVIYDMAGQGNSKQPRPKIRGSQFVKREEKKMPKLIIRPPIRQPPPRPK